MFKKAILFGLIIGSFFYILSPIHETWDCWWWNVIAFFIASLLIDSLRVCENKYFN